MAVIRRRFPNRLQENRNPYMNAARDFTMFQEPRNPYATHQDDFLAYAEGYYVALYSATPTANPFSTGTPCTLCSRLELFKYIFPPLCPSCTDNIRILIGTPPSAFS